MALLFSAPCLAAEAFTWGTDLEAAKQTAARSNKLVLLHFGAAWCQPCQQLERDVFNRPGFGKELKQHYVGVKLDYDHFPATARQYGVQSIPTDVILTPQGKLVERVQSPLNGQDYIASLTRVANVVHSSGVPAAAPATVPLAQPNAVAAAAPAAATAPTTPATTTPPPAGGRYADYYTRQQAADVAPPQNPSAPPPVDAAAPPAVPPSANAYAAQPTAPPAAGPNLGAPLAANAAAAAPPPPAPTQPMVAPPQAAPQIAAGNAPLGLDGFCPVSLCEKQAWSPGDARWGMQHRGRTYLFAGPTELQRFSENPDRYSPVMSGNDPVLALDRGQATPGHRMYGVYYGGHVYLFASEQCLQTFTQNPNRYSAEAVQARR